MINNYEKFPLKKITLIDALRLIESAAVKITEECSNKVIFEGSSYELIESNNEELLSRVISNIDCQFSVEYDIVITIELALIVNNMEFEKYKQMPTVRDIMRACEDAEIIEVRYRDQKYVDPAELHIIIDGEYPKDSIRSNVTIGNTDLLDYTVKDNSMCTILFRDGDDEPYIKHLIFVDRRKDE